MFKIKSKKVQFLNGLKKEIEELPMKIWDYEDIDNKDYKIKRKKLIGQVLNIRNRISSYVYANHNYLVDEFKNYSFFPKNMLFEPFHEENNKAWKEGKMNYMYFIDKLITFAEAEESFDSTNVTNLIVKLFIFIVLVIITGFIIFSNQKLNIIGYEIGVKGKILLLLLGGIGWLNVIWFKNKKDFLPFTTGIIGAIIGAL